MTEIADDKVVKRLTKGRYKDRNLVVELHPGFMVLYPKGTQQKYRLDYEVAYESAMKVTLLGSK